MQTRPLAPRLTAQAIAVIALALPASTGYAHDEPIDAAAAAKLQSLTNQMIGGVGEYHRASGLKRAAVAAKMKTTAAERYKLMLASLERQPGLTLRRALPAGLTANLPNDVRNLLEREVELTGRIVHLHSDDMERGTCSNRFFLEVDGAAAPVSMRLHAADKPDHAGHEHPAARFVGRTVSVRATRFDSQLLIADEGSIEAGSDGTAGGATATVTAEATLAGAQNTLVLLANFQDKALTCTAGSVDSMVFGATNSVNDLYRQTSNGNVTFAGATYGPYAIPFSSTTCDFSAWSAELDRTATAQGINLAQYPRRVYVFPNNACSAAGVGSVGGTTTSAWIFRCGLADLYAHELGHNLGFRHAGTPAGEYSDTSDVMGFSGQPLRQLNAPNKVRAGWIPATHVREVSASGTFTIAPTAAANPVNPQALALAKPDTSDYYYISLRQPIGYDTSLNTTYKNRVSVHRGSASALPTTLLATLDPGQSYSDAVNGYQFTVNSVSADSASVSVATAAPQCVRAAPTITVSPLTQSGAPGRALGYEVTVRNNNNSGCGTGTFAFTPNVPAGWSSSNSPATLSLGTGASATSTWTVTSPAAGLAEQSYPVALAAYDAGAVSSTASVQASYIVTIADATPPTVAITSPANGAAGLSGTVTVSANAGDNIGVAKVEFSVNGSLVSTDTAAPYSFGWNTRKLSGTHTLTAVSVDAAGNRSAPHSVSVSVGGGTRKR